MVLKLVTLDDLERRDGRYIAFFTEFGKVRCRREESSQSLSHFLNLDEFLVQLLTLLSAEIGEEKDF